MWLASGSRREKAAERIAKALEKLVQSIVPEADKAGKRFRVVRIAGAHIGRVRISQGVHSEMREM
jgi:hypothetical protein